jgi:hypothetical protein
VTRSQCVQPAAAFEDATAATASVQRNQERPRRLPTDSLRDVKPVGSLVAPGSLVQLDPIRARGDIDFRRQRRRATDARDDRNAGHGVESATYQHAYATRERHRSLAHNTYVHPGKCVVIVEMAADQKSFDPMYKAS